MKLSKKVIFLPLFLVLLLFNQNAVASEIDILVDKLVEKGILNESDAKAILQETKEEAKKEREETIEATKDAIMDAGDGVKLVKLPAWIENTKFKGDFRLRYQLLNRHGRADRHLGRYRLRLGFTTPITDKVKLGFGLATGGANPRSTNQTMVNSFDTPDIRLDYAYASYKPFDWVELIGGKMPNPVWKPTNMLWDGDIRPEGVSALFKYKTEGGIDLFCNTGFWIIDEYSNNEEDPIMIMIQPGYKIKIGDNAYFKNALGIYEFRNVKGNAIDYSSGSNTLTRNGVLEHDYDAFVVSGELGFSTNIDVAPFFAVMGEYINSRGAGTEDNGYIFGFKVGDKKVGKKNTWQLKGNYRRLEMDAWPDFLPDADIYSGQTDVQSYCVGFKYGLEKNIIFATTYRYSQRLKRRTLGEDLFQCDLMLKF